MKKLLGLPYPKDAKKLEAAKAYANSAEALHKTELLIGFLAGAKWAEEQINNIWHNASEKPCAKEWLLIQFGKDDYDTHYLNDLYIDMWCTWCKTYNVIQWAYIKDLLPKGGEK